MAEPFCTTRPKGYATPSQPREDKGQRLNRVTVGALAFVFHKLREAYINCGVMSTPNREILVDVHLFCGNV